MSDSETNSRRVQPAGFKALMDHMVASKVESLLWMTRMCTVIFTFLYMLPFFGFNPYSCYQKVLLSNAATSALRLHQRIPRVHLSLQFVRTLFREDSCHYLIYSIIFISAYPMTLVLLPVFLFALLHVSSFSVTMLSKAGLSHLKVAEWLSSLVENQQRSILQLAAFTEVFLFPLTLTQLFRGQASLLTPFAYYQFLKLRYSSQRNPYPRNVYHELRVAITVLVSRPGCPQFIRNTAYGLIAFVSRLAPETAPQG